MNVLLVCGFDSSHTRTHFYFAVCRCVHWLQDRSRTGVIIVVAAMELRSWCRNNVTCKECLVMGSAASPSSQTCFSVGPRWLRLEKLLSTWGCHIQAATASGMMVFFWKTIRGEIQMLSGDHRKAQTDWRLLNICQSEFILIPWCVRYLSHCCNNMLTLKKEGLIWFIVWENNPSWEGSHSSLCLRQRVSSHPWSRIRDQLMVSQLSPLYSVQNPSSWNGAIHICGRSLCIN